MILAILLGLQILCNFLVCVESIDERGKRWRDGITDREQPTKDFMIKIISKLYEKAIIATSSATLSAENAIPHPNCYIPFNYWVGAKLRSKNHICINNGVKIFCSRMEKYVEGKTYTENCILKSTDSADPKIWKPHPNCVPLFLFYNNYYKGCTNTRFEVFGRKPRCASTIQVIDSRRWFDCINIEKIWTQWSSWTKCSQTCEGSKTRTRQCLQTGRPSSGCSDGNPTEQESCNPKSCPINGGWSNWSPSGVCSKICGTGSQVNLRECNNPKPKFGGKDCGNDAVKIVPCKLAECSDDKEDLSKMSNRNGYAKILYSIFGSFGALILIAAVIAGVIYRRKKRRNIPETTTGESYNLYEESGMD